YYFIWNINRIKYIEIYSIYDLFLFFLITYKLLKIYIIIIKYKFGLSINQSIYIIILFKVLEIMNIYFYISKVILRTNLKRIK
ncbi:hypothetical protein PFDG_05171, partial [Plasmodium falciparum Dd2]